MGRGGGRGSLSRASLPREGRGDATTKLLSVEDAGRVEFPVLRGPPAPPVQHRVRLLGAPRRAARTAPRGGPSPLHRKLRGSLSREKSPSCESKVGRRNVSVSQIAEWESKWRTRLNETKNGDAQWKWRSVDLLPKSVSHPFINGPNAFRLIDYVTNDWELLLYFLIPLGRLLNLKKSDGEILVAYYPLPVDWSAGGRGRGGGNRRVRRRSRPCMRTANGSEAQARPRANVSHGATPPRMGGGWM